jgi:hypothetical protein
VFLALKAEFSGSILICNFSSFSVCQNHAQIFIHSQLHSVELYYLHIKHTKPHSTEVFMKVDSSSRGLQITFSYGNENIRKARHRTSNRVYHYTIPLIPTFILLSHAPLSSKWSHCVSSLSYVLCIHMRKLFYSVESIRNFKETPKMLVQLSAHIFQIRRYLSL